MKSPLDAIIFGGGGLGRRRGRERAGGASLFEGKEAAFEVRRQMTKILTGGRGGTLPAEFDDE